MFENVYSIRLHTHWPNPDQAPTVVFAQGPEEVAEAARLLASGEPDDVFLMGLGDVTFELRGKAKQTVGVLQLWIELNRLGTGQGMRLLERPRELYGRLVELGVLTGRKDVRPRELWGKPDRDDGLLESRAEITDW